MADRVGDTNSQVTHNQQDTVTPTSLGNPQTETKVAAMAPSAITIVSRVTRSKMDESLIIGDAKKIAWMELVRNPELNAVKSEEINELIESNYDISNQLKNNSELIKVFYTTLFDEIGGKPDIYNESYIEGIFKGETLFPFIFLEINELKKVSDQILNPVDRSKLWLSYYGWFGDFLATKYIQDLKLEPGGENWEITSRLAKKTLKDLFYLAVEKYKLDFLLHLDPRVNQGQTDQMIAQSITYFHQVVVLTVSNSPLSALASNLEEMKPFNFLDDWKKKNIPAAGDLSIKLGKDLASHYLSTKFSIPPLEECFARLNFIATEFLYGLNDFCKKTGVDYSNCRASFQEEFKGLASKYKSQNVDKNKFTIDLEVLEEISPVGLKQIAKSIGLPGTSPIRYPSNIGYPTPEELSTMAQKIAEDLWQKLSSSPEGKLDELKSTSNSDAFTKACKYFELDPHFNDLKIDESEKKIRNQQKEDLKTFFIKNWESFKNDFYGGEKFAQSCLNKVKQRRGDSIPNPGDFFEKVIKLAQKKGQSHSTSEFYKDGFINYINKVQQNNQSVKEQTGAPGSFKESPIIVESKQDNVTTVEEGKSKKADKNRKRKERARAKAAEEKRVKEEAAKEVAVTKLQKTARGFIAKKAAQKEVENKVAAAKAAEEKRVKEEAAKEVAVTKLQKTARGFIARKSIQKEEQIASIAEKAAAALKAAAQAAAQAAAAKAAEEATKYQLQREKELKELAEAKDTATLLQTHVNQLQQNLQNAVSFGFTQQVRAEQAEQALVAVESQRADAHYHATLQQQRAEAAEAEIFRLQGFIQQLMANQHGY